MLAKVGGPGASDLRRNTTDMKPWQWTSSTIETCLRTLPHLHKTFATTSPSIYLPLLRKEHLLQVDETIFVDVGRGARK